MGATERGVPFADLTDPADAAATTEEIADWIDLHALIDASGTLAARPAAAPENRGTYYWAVDQGRVYRSDGADWDDIVAGHEGTAAPHAGHIAKGLIDAKGDLLVGTANDTVDRLAVGADRRVLRAASAQAKGMEWSPADMHLLAETTLGADAASISFQSIPATHRHLHLMLEGRGSREDSGVHPTVWLRFNNDAGNNYDDTRKQGGGQFTPADDNATATAQIRAGWLPAGSASVEDSGGLLLWVFNYANVTRRKRILSWGGGPPSGGIASFFLVAGLWRSAAAINRLDLLVSADNFEAGTVASLYGLGVI